MDTNPLHRCSFEEETVANTHIYIYFHNYIYGISIII